MDETKNPAVIEHLFLMKQEFSECLTAAICMLLTLSDRSDSRKEAVEYATGLAVLKQALDKIEGN